MELTFRLTAAQAAAWLAWWQTDLGHGGAWFQANTWLMPWGQGATVRFTGGPEFTAATSAARSTLRITAEVRGERPAFGPAGVHIMNTTDRGTNQREEPYLAGYTLRVRWNQIQTGASTYNWTLIDEVMQRTQSRRQKVTLEIFARDVPAHVMSALTEATWADHRGFVTAVPWDAAAVAAWETFVAVLAAHETPLSSGGGTVPLASHPALLTVDAPLVGQQSVRDIAGTLVLRADYSRATYVAAAVAAVQVIRDNFPNQYCFVGVFPMYDAESDPRVDLAIVDALLEEFVPEGTADPKLGFFQELLSDAGPDTGLIGTPLLRARQRTWVMFQALTNWSTPWTGQDKVASGHVATGLAYALNTYGARYVELYAKDITNPEFQDELALWGRVLSGGRHPLPPVTAPVVNITEPDEGELVAGSINITAAVTPSGTRTITQAQFWVDGVLLQTDTVAPWGYTWNTTALVDGTHTIEVRATDSAGAVGSGWRNCVTQNGNLNPYVVFTAPDLDVGVSGLVSIEVTAVGFSAITSVAIYVDGVLKKTDTSTPYTYTWDSDTVLPGYHTLRATATDADSRVTTLEVEVFVLNNT